MLHNFSILAQSTEPLSVKMVCLFRNHNLLNTDGFVIQLLLECLCPTNIFAVDLLLISPQSTCQFSFLVSHRLDLWTILPLLVSILHRDKAPINSPSLTIHYPL